MLLRKFLGSLLLPCAALAGGWLVSAPADAFPHVVQPGDTLAALAERYYGRIQNERILVIANGLDRADRATITPGMVLEIPALTHHRVQAGDTWKSLATELLGAPHREVVLALSNDSKPWLLPEPGTIVRVPFNLVLVATGEDSLATVAYRYMGSTKQAWTLSYYNQLEKSDLRRGDLFLVPLTDLPLTEEGRQAARRAARVIATQADAPERSQQQKVEAEVPALVADVRAGRYVQAVTRGVRLLASGELSEPQLARIHRQLLEAYVALDAVGQAVDSCANWRKHDAAARLDPVLLSPKILAACERAPAAHAAPTPAGAPQETKAP
jgi:phage tail protein X